FGIFLFACLIINDAVFAQDAIAAAPAIPVLDSGSTAWMMVSTLLVLMMTLPGLALFYGGMVHRESVLTTLMQSFVSATIISVLWVLYGYSFIFTENNGFIGGFDKILLSGISKDALSGVIPESVFIMFQMTFGIITCALIFGSVATRIKFSSALVFIVAWFTLVYIPVAHWVWGPNGMLGGVGIDDYKGLFGFGATLDYAGGTVVHINAGIAGLMAALILGNQKGFDMKPRRMAQPYNIVFSIIGASLLWVGWFGFNAGSAVAANGSAGMAMLVTQVSAAMGSLSWMAIEWKTNKKPSVLGIISGAVSGLVAITPACGFVDVGGALVIGALAGVGCFYACRIKFKFNFDDSLDVFGVHCVGGIIGALLTGVFAVKEMGGVDGSFIQFIAQCEGVAVTIIYGSIMSYIILKIINVIMGMRVDDKVEYEGMDLTTHGETLH
ncbi:MAG: ammonium transporter, partial [Rickettsiales bacterium]